ncbi:prenyltransferase [Flavobacteriaceae bacterium]
MKVLKIIFQFYINSSIHVGLSCFALVQVTQIAFHISQQNTVGYFAFWGTIVGYNFVKYAELASAKRLQMRKQLRVITVFTFCSFILVGYYFFLLESLTKIVAFIFLGLTMLYTLPFFPNRKNARNWAGVKIYIVSFCWVGASVFLPLLNASFSLNTNTGIFSIQRFLLIFVLILIFEIIDLRFDNPNLRTVPQQIGVKNTKILGYVLLFIFCALEVFNFNGNNNVEFLPLQLNFAIAIVIALFLAFANERRSKYYTSFWVESVPVVWWVFINITIQ